MNPPARSIEPLDSRDPAAAVAIRDLLRESYAEEARLLGLDVFPPLGRTADHVRTSSSLFLGCRIEDELVAIAEIESGDDAVNIAGFVVAPARFRRGVGAALLRHVLEAYAPRPITVSTAEANVPAVALYGKQGFRVVRRWRAPGGIPMVTMRRESPLDRIHRDGPLPE